MRLTTSSVTPPDEEGRTLYGILWQQVLRADATSHLGGGPSGLQPIKNPRMKLAATVVLPDERREPLAFEPDPTEPDAFTAAFDVASPGRYRISLDGGRRGPTEQASDRQEPCLAW